MKRSSLPVLFLVFVSLVISACATESANIKGNIYEVTGRVVEVDDIDASLVVAHQDIPGLMPAMTMPFKVKDIAELSKVSPGDAVRFQLVTGTESAWIEGITAIADESVPLLETINSLPSETSGPSDESIYLHDARWTDQEGNPIQLASFSGKPVLISMIFTRCGYACPRIVHDMKRIGEELDEEIGKEVQYVLVSIDPDHDTPAMLRLFAGAHGLDSGRWTLLRGEESDIRVLAALLGVRYKKDPNELYSHTNLITLLDEKGEIVHRQKGLNVAPDETVAVMNGLFAAGM